MRKAPRLTQSIEIIYAFVVGSLHYWGTLIRSGLIYGFSDAALGMVFFLQEAKGLSKNGSNIEQVKIEKNRGNVPYGKGLSFIWTGLLSLCVASFLSIKMGVVYSISSLLLVTSLTLFSFYHVFLVLAICLSSDRNETYKGKWFYAYTLDYLIRNPFKSLFILMLTWSAMGIAYFNLILFIFLVPSIYWLLIQKGLKVKL
ncbi:hypothetical protein [Carnobacterium sp.]|uniref:hypothetical protein n=1 Tax=Carnobacterium sp. TaxID=48221 RepID=UPI00388D7CDD